MKICAACSQELPKERFSKKQWQLKGQRRCKECIAGNREVNLDVVPTDAPPPVSSSATGGKGASYWTDKELFKEPQREECPICMLPLPINIEEISYHPCCGKTLCGGCIHADDMRDKRRLCPFCRTSAETSEEEYRNRINTRAEADDANAIYMLGKCYDDGLIGLPQNKRKANKLWLRAGKLGCAKAYCNLGASYIHGEGVERDEKKGEHYLELAAMGGSVTARYNLGIEEAIAGNMNRAMKHFMISAGEGDDDSLTKIRECFIKGHATKDDFETALRAHKGAKDEMKSDQREAAAAFYGQN